MEAHWGNFPGILILAIIFHSKCSLGQNTEIEKSHQLSLCSDHRLYHEETKKCYVPKTRGPCGEQMVLEEFEGSGIGVCRCDIRERNLHNCPIRPRVFLPKYSRCFSLFDQGPCKEGEWLIQSEDENRTLTCQLIPCPERYKEQYKNEGYKNGARDSNKFVFGYEGKCYETQTKDHGNLCKEDEKVIFVGIENIFYHKCATGLACGTSGFSGNGCRDGVQPDIHGGCEPNLEIK